MSLLIVVAIAYASFGLLTYLLYYGLHKAAGAPWLRGQDHRVFIVMSAILGPVLWVAMVVWFGILFYDRDAMRESLERDG